MEQPTTVAPQGNSSSGRDGCSCNESSDTGRGVVDDGDDGDDGNDSDDGDDSVTMWISVRTKNGMRQASTRRCPSPTAWMTSVGSTLA